MSKASENQMNVLHGRLAQTLTTMVSARTVTKRDAEGNEYVEEVDPSPATLAVAAKFLKDNAVTMTPEQSEATDELAQALEARRLASKQRLRITQADMKEALAKVGSGLLQ